MKKGGKTNNPSSESLDEDFYRYLFENAAAGIGRSAWDDGRMLFANQRLAEIFGYDDRDEFIRDYVFSEHYSDQKDRERELASYLAHPGELVEATYPRKDGTLVHIQAEVRADQDQRYIDFVAIDVTDKKRVQAELKKSIEEKSQAEDLIRTMIENSPVPLSLKDQDGKYTFVNRAYAGYLELSVDEVLGKTPIELLGEDVGQTVLNADQTVLSTGESLIEEDSFAVKVGDSTLQVSKFPVPDADGKIHRTASVGVDITELERTRQALHDRTVMLEEAERNAQLGHWSWNEAGDEMVYCSAQAASIFKMTPEELIVRFGNLENELELVLEEDRDKFHREVSEFMDKLKSQPDQPYQTTFEYRVKLDDGSIRHLRETNGTEFDQDGQIVRSVGTVQDITELANTREALQGARSRRSRPPRTRPPRP